MIRKGRVRYTSVNEDGLVLNGFRPVPMLQHSCKIAIGRAECGLSRFKELAAYIQLNNFLLHGGSRSEPLQLGQLNDEVFGLFKFKNQTKIQALREDKILNSA